MQLANLIQDMDVTVTGPDDLEIIGLTADSREAKTGFLFAAFPGITQDGRDFIAAAKEAGALAVLVPEGTACDHSNMTLITAKNPRQIFAKMAGVFYGQQIKTIAAVTGTNGKSSTVHFCRQIWQAMDHAAAAIGTLGITAPGIERKGALTTPDPVTLHAEIAELEAAGVTHLAMEASSQGLDQYRLDGLQVTTAGFTNLSRDHLDYHGTMEKYLSAKLRLFEEILHPGGAAVINADSDVAKDIRDICYRRGIRVIDYGAAAADIHLLARKPLPNGQFIALQIGGERYELELPLVGAFQVENALCALGLVIASDPDNKLLQMQTVHALERLTPVRGRLEKAGTLSNGAMIYVDYAHTPGGLETMLRALRPHAPQKLHIVFGCGGDRDKGKRPMMGGIADKLADHVIVTDDNPRTEDAAIIRDEILQGCPHAKEIAGRADAIRTAIQTLETDDILVIAGKGHEQGQIIGTEIHPFDDVEEVKKAISETSS